MTRRPVPLPRLGRAARAIVAGLGCGSSAFAAANEPAPPPARGLIVKLKDAPAHAALFGAPRHPDAPRWQRVLVAGKVAPLSLRATGRSSQLLEFGRVLPGEEARELAQALRRQPDVEWVVPNEREHRLQVPNDPGFRDPRGTALGQWWLYPASGSNRNVLADRLRGVPGVQSAWVTTSGSAHPIVAVVDTGWTDHRDLAGRWVLPGHDFVSEVEFANDGNGRDADASDPGDWVSAADLAKPAFAGCKVQDSSWHGTVVAGQIAAVTNNAEGVAGVNWNGRVLPVRVSGKCGAEVADVIDGLRWAGGLAVAGVPPNPTPARIVNVSFGGSAPCTPAYQEAIDELLARDVIVVAAAGNESGAPTRPASCANVVGVAALNRDGFKASYSNFGPALAIATVGGDEGGGAWAPFLGDSGVLTTVNFGLRGPGQGGYAFVGGTSFAAPIVSGVASLMLSANPSLTGRQLIEGLKSSARPHVVSGTHADGTDKIAACSPQNPGRCICTTSTCGAGILDAPQALAYATAQSGTYVAPARSPEVIDNAEVDQAIRRGPDLVSGGAGGGGGGDGGGGALDGAAIALLAVGLLALAAGARRGDKGARRS